MKNYLKLFLLGLVLGSSSFSTAQKWDMSGSKKEGTIYFLDGTSQKGKLKFDETSLTIIDGKSKKGIDINTVDWFEAQGKKELKKYAFVLGERSFKKKKKQKFLCYLEADIDGNRLYNEPNVGASIGAFSVSQAVFIVQKKGSPFAVKADKKRLKEYFNECPEIIDRISSDFKRNRKSLTALLEYYSINCNKESK